MKILILLTFISFNLQAKLLDKTVAIFNGEVLTLSQVKRVKASLPARKNIIPQIYRSTKLNNKEVVNIMIHRRIIRSKLNEVGYVTSDEEVESNIKQREKMLGVNRKQLIVFLSNNNINFDEYFEITREALENQRFTQWVIQPLISVTEQEIKNYFYKLHKDNKTLSFKYKLIDFSIPKKAIPNKKTLRELQPALVKFQDNGILPNKFESIETNDLGNITEENLAVNLKKLLKNTEEGKFSKPILMNGSYHVFYLKQKELVESEFYQKNKNQIKAQLFQKSIDQVEKVWFEGEMNKHYVRFYL